MYEAVKKLAKRWLPKQLLLKNELFLRKILAVKYRGTEFGCNICESKLSAFIPLGNGETLCPACGSLPRNRRLWKVLMEEDLLHGNVLDFSPSRCLARKMRVQKRIRYVSSDFVGEFEAEKSHDITAIAEPDSEFDLVLCYHVLEHVDDDRQAMRELFRVLKPSGKALVQTPLKAGDIYEDTNIVSPEARLKHFGQADHVRVYSANGLAGRLKEAGFQVEIKQFGENQPSDQFLGMKENEIVLIASKPDVSQA
ncbi:MAG: class I SAM-dependent methyltransferase [Saprospiraceae bacterium]|nr:class I SAM-dependent methyltransferase [Saprospiraceae bacterium]MCF8249395.1 class I SAM-dependent methyltransferase [Saprospiraceae bacterium]MCF8279049.1 class I SAM-dependent methyltransferase [Bacteroidales bacterium]MCF8311524.1 class I SAM-dependent methyltransferase [Saprospiraceae bacterium]MCF8440014.1 class I SAM-dependent methyltransferase [Saprospiraceae bacterium]